MERVKLYNNLFSVFLVNSQGDIYIKDYGKFILKRYLDKFPVNPDEFLSVVKENYEDIKGKVLGLIRDGEMRDYDYFGFFEEGEVLEEERRDWWKLMKNVKNVDKFSVQLYSQELNWVSGRYYQNLMREVDASLKIKKNCNIVLRKGVERVKEANEVKKEYQTKMSEMEVKTASLEKVVERLTEEGKEIPTCCICVNVQDLVVFAPCGHQIVCENCFKKLKKMECPMCRGVIKSHCRIFT